MHASCDAQEFGMSHILRDMSPACVTRPKCLVGGGKTSAESLAKV